MNREQFDRWIEKHGRLFPGLRTWLAERGPDIEAILDAWIEVMESIPISQAELLTSRMLSGDVEPLDRWTMERLPARVIAMKQRLWSIEDLNKRYSPDRGMS